MTKQLLFPRRKFSFSRIQAECYATALENSNSLVYFSRIQIFIPYIASLYVKCNTLRAINRGAHIVRRLKPRDNLYTKWQRLCQPRYDEIIAPLATRAVHPLTFNIRV